MTKGRPFNEKLKLIADARKLLKRTGKNKMSQRQVAIALGVHYNTINRWVKSGLI